MESYSFEKFVAGVEVTIVRGMGGLIRFKESDMPKLREYHGKGMTLEEAAAEVIWGDHGIGEE